MKIIRPNNIKVEKIPKINTLKATIKERFKQEINIDDGYIQYVTSELDGNLLKCDMHPFVEAAHLAYTYHVPLVISPDMIWYLITNAAAAHITKNSEELRSTFINQTGKAKID